MPASGTAQNEGLKELQSKLQERVAAGKALLAPYEGKGVPPEVNTQVKAVFGEIDGLKAAIEAHRQLAGIESDMAQPTTTPVAFRPAVADEGDELPVDRAAWREYEAKSSYGLTEKRRYHVPLPVYANVKKIKNGQGQVLNDKQYQRAYDDGFELYQRKGRMWVAENYPVEYKALSEGLDSAGGFTVPVDYQARIITKLAAECLVRPNATVMQSNRDIVVFPRIPYNAAATDDSGNKRWTSAVRMTWGGESPATSTTARVTDQTVGQIECKVNTAISSQLVSNDLLEDNAVDLGGYIVENTGEAFVLGEDYAFIQGNGVAQPLGLVTSAQNGTIGYTPSGTSADIQTTGDSFSGARLVQTYYALPAQYRRMAMWMCSSITMQQIESLVDANKRPLISSLINGANLSTATPETIKSRPVGVDEFMPDYNAANAFSMVIGDFKGYTIVDRVQFSIQRYDLYVETNFTLFLARKRVGGVVTHPWKFNFLKSAVS